MVMLGALCSLIDFPFDIGDIEDILEDVFPKSKLKSNLKALESGQGLIRGNTG